MTTKAPSKEAMEATIECNHGHMTRVCRPCFAAALESFATDMNDGDRTFKRLAQTERERDALSERNRALVGMIAAWHSGGHAGANHPGHRDACEVGMCGMYRGALAADAKVGEDAGE